MPAHDDLRIERVRQRLSQLQLSKLTGIGPTKISKYENGWVELSADEISSIRRALRLRRPKVVESGAPALERP